MPKWWWERWRRGGKRLWRDEPHAHQKMAEAEPELIDESERWRDEERRKQEKKS
jgi:hypothetical protein